MPFENWSLTSLQKCSEKRTLFLRLEWHLQETSFQRRSALETRDSHDNLYIFWNRFALVFSMPRGFDAFRCHS